MVAEVPQLVQRRPGRGRRCGRAGCPERVYQPVVGRPRRYCSPACCQSAWWRRQRTAQLVHHSSESAEWYTPLPLWEQWNDLYGPFTLDPCADPRAPLWSRIPQRFTAADDGLSRPWTGIVWCNPPYGDAVAAWVAYAAAQWALGLCERIVLLVRASTDTAWWWSAIEAGAEPVFLRGRIRFVLPDGTLRSSAPFSSALLVFG